MHKTVNRKHVYSDLDSVLYITCIVLTVKTKIPIKENNEQALVGEIERVKGRRKEITQHINQVCLYMYLYCSKLFLPLNY